MDIKRVKEKGVKLTKHKSAILELFSLYKHLDASKIYNILNNQGIQISLATIYRILTSFEVNGIVEKHNFNNDQATYELINPDEHHDHLICIHCHKVLEFLNENIEQLQMDVAKSYGFKIISHSLNIYGICNDCNK